MFNWDDIDRKPVYQAPKWARDGYRAHYSYIDEIRRNAKGATNMPQTIETFYADNKPYHHVQTNPGISRVIFNDPATIIFWKDGTKTVVKCQDGDTYSKETGLALCIAKKALGNKGNFNNVFKKWCEEENE